MENIFYTLVKNDAFLSHNKFQYHKVHSLGFFVEINPRVIVRETLRRRIHDQLMLINIDAEASQDMIYQELESKLNSKRNPTEKNNNPYLQFIQSRSC